MREARWARKRLVPRGGVAGWSARASSTRLKARTCSRTAASKSDCSSARSRSGARRRVHAGGGSVLAMMRSWCVDGGVGLGCEEGAAAGAAGSKLSARLDSGASAAVASARSSGWRLGASRGGVNSSARGGAGGGGGTSCGSALAGRCVSWSASLAAARATGSAAGDAARSRWRASMAPRPTSCRAAVGSATSCCITLRPSSCAPVEHSAIASSCSSERSSVGSSATSRGLERPASSLERRLRSERCRTSSSGCTSFEARPCSIAL